MENGGWKSWEILKFCILCRYVNKERLVESGNPSSGACWKLWETRKASETNRVHYVENSVENVHNLLY